MTSTQRVPRVVPLFNRLVRPLLAAGMPMGFNGLLTVPGRTSGQPRTTPLAIIEIDGRRWVWSPWGEVHWVRNLRAAGQATLVVRRRAETVHAVELDPAERLGFFRDTFGPLARRIPGGAMFVRLLDGVDVNDPEAAADGRAVFELLPVPGEVSRPPSPRP
jgi:deazaflavin-dependent oxidoreductase (nitroreductase family)